MICSIFLIFYLMEVSLIPPTLSAIQYVMDPTLQYFIIYLTLLGLELIDISDSAAGPTPMFTEKMMPKVSPALPYMMGSSMQYFIICTV